ncbi:MAG: hypothetical protein K0U68_08045, partial [Gammaproteobacteria bacterium]|nr:hypothetical protein [Gammaproteobacteria bacterium]
MPGLREHAQPQPAAPTRELTAVHVATTPDRALELGHNENRYRRSRSRDDTHHESHSARDAHGQARNHHARHGPYHLQLNPVDHSVDLLCIHAVHPDTIPR